MENQLYLSSSPHVHSGETTDRVMREVIYALLPACAVAIYFFGLAALLVLVLCTAGCVGDRGRSAAGDGTGGDRGRRQRRPDRHPAGHEPAALRPLVAGPGRRGVAIAIGKQVYGGLGHNPFNPALVARVVLLISFPVQMTTWTAPAPLGSGLDAVTSATPLGLMKKAVMLTGKLPRRLQGGRGLPARQHGRLPRRGLGRRPASRGRLPLLAQGPDLAHPRRLPRHGGGLLRDFLAGRPQPLPQSPLPARSPAGLILGAFFMATDMVTSPVTTRGMLIFGAGCGLITVLIRLFGGYPEGVSFAILLMNAATPLIDRFTRPKKFGSWLSTGREGAMKEIVRLVLALTVIAAGAGLILSLVESAHPRTDRRAAPAGDASRPSRRCCPPSTTSPTPTA